jgi:uncharacterized protein
MRRTSRKTFYLAGEGVSHLDECLAITLEQCFELQVETLLIYTASGAGPIRAIDRLQVTASSSRLKLVAVTLPIGKAFINDLRLPEAEQKVVRGGLPPEVQERLEGSGVTIVPARLPFSSIAGAPADQWSTVDTAFGILGGGFSLCVQSVMVACDAGAIRQGERVAAMTADTAIIALATHTESFLSKYVGLIVEHVICRPSVYDVSKHEHRHTEMVLRAREEKAQQRRQARALKKARETDEPE